MKPSPPAFRCARGAVFAMACSRAALTAAGQRRQVLDRLKDRKRQDHAVEAARRDAVALDEVALNGHIRRLAS